MKRPDLVSSKILSLEGVLQKTSQWRVTGKKIAFSNGIFDILHRGHIFSLSAAAREADFLVVGLNSDESCKRLKGDSRPINGQVDRALILASLLIVDAVVIFEEDTPINLIKAIMPDVLIKGGDYTIDQIAGAKEVQAAGGRVVINSTLEGFSTTGIISQLKSS